MPNDPRAAAMEEFDCRWPDAPTGEREAYRLGHIIGYADAKEAENARLRAALVDIRIYAAMPPRDHHVVELCDAALEGAPDS